MTNRNSHLKLEAAFPQFWQSEYGRAVHFMEKYYRYLDSTYNGNLDSIKDVDAVDASFLGAYKLQYGIDSPNPVTDVREFLKNSRQFFLRKGTPEAIRYFFRAVFGDEAVVSYPKDQILRSSDGRWSQSSFMTVLPITGTIPPAPFDIIIENDRGTFTVPITSVDYTEQDTPRFYFKTNKKLFLDPNQSFKIYSEDTGEAVFLGQVLLSPSRLKIGSPGANWQRGQIFTVPGVFKNTVGRVLDIDDNKGIKKLEIIEYGLGHTPGQVSQISPYRNKPATSNNALITSTVTSVSPLTYAHSVTVQDYTDGIFDSVTGFSDNQAGFTRVFLEDYVLRGYVGGQVIEQITLPTINQNTSVDVDLTNWLLSQAYLSYEFSDIATEKGEYKTYDGQLSHPEIKTQDNYFYQAFSYLIETREDIRDYRSILSNIHPAGLKFFTSLDKVNAFNVAPEVLVKLSAENIFLLDIFKPDDAYSLNLSKPVFEQVFMDNSELIALHLTKNLNIEFIVPQDDNTKHVFKNLLDDGVAGEVLVSKDIGKNTTESISVPDVNTKSVTKPIDETGTASDNYSAAFSKAGINSLVDASTDQAALTPTKNLSESTAISDDDFYSLFKSVPETVNLVELAAINFNFGTFTETIEATDSILVAYGILLQSFLDSPTDTSIFDLSKTIAEIVTATESAMIFAISKTLQETAISTDQISNDLSKSGIDSTLSAPTDQIAARDFGKNTAETAISTDQIAKAISKAGINSALSSPTDQPPVFSVNKYNTDTATATSLDNAAVSTVSYADNEFFAEDFTTREYSLTVG